MQQGAWLHRGRPGVPWLAGGGDGQRAPCSLDSASGSGGMTSASSTAGRSEGALAARASGWSLRATPDGEAPGAGTQ